MGWMPLWSKGSWAPLEPSYDSPLSFMILTTRGWAEISRYGKSLCQIRHQLSESRDCTNIRSNSALPDASVVRSGRIRCPNCSVWNSLQLCSLRLFHWTSFWWSFEAIFEKCSAGTDSGKFQISPSWAISFHICLFPAQQSWNQELVHFCNY